MSRILGIDPRYDEERSCPECASTHLVLDDVRGEVTCDECGLVLSDRAMDASPEWSAYSAEEAARSSHTGARRDPIAGATGLTTVIPAPRRDAHGNAIPLEGRSALYRIQRLQRHASHGLPGERSLPEATRVLERFVAALDLPRNVRDEAAFLCRKAIQRQLARGRSIEILVAATVYAACRIAGVPRTLDEVQRMTGMSKIRVGAAYRCLHRELSLAVHIPRPGDYVERFCSELDLDRRVERESRALLERFDPPGNATSVSPSGSAGAAIYLAALVCGEPRSEKAIAQVAGVSEVTLRNRYLEMKALLPTLEVPRGRTPRSPRTRP